MSFIPGMNVLYSELVFYDSMDHRRMSYFRLINSN